MFVVALKTAGFAVSWSRTASWEIPTVFLTSFILPRVRGTVLLHITPAVLVGACTEKNFIVFISQFSWPKKPNIL
jgi:hypothetical protein